MYRVRLNHKNVVILWKGQYTFKHYTTARRLQQPLYCSADGEHSF